MLLPEVVASSSSTAAKQSRVVELRHVPALDGVRGIAILLVLLFHFPAPFAWLRPLTSVGWCGVDLFFVLSGYLITGILYSSTSNPQYFGNFYIRRSLRIFPLYYAFLILAVLILPRMVNPYWIGLETLRGSGIEYFLYYSNYTNAFLEWSPVALGAFWSLAVEEHFYLFWPMFIKVTPRNKLIVACLIIASLALLSRLAITAFKITWLAAYYLTTSRVDSLVIGAMTAVLVRQYPSFPVRWVLALGAITLGSLLAIAAWRGGLTFNDWPMRTFGYTILALFFAAFVWLAGTTQGVLATFLANPILVAFGKYSYCLYICHMMVLTYTERWLGPHVFPVVGWSGSAPLPLFAVSMTASFLIAYLSWHVYEGPILSLKARFTQ